MILDYLGIVNGEKDDYATAGLGINVAHVPIPSRFANSAQPDDLDLLSKTMMPFLCAFCAQMNKQAC
jgi:hypothetical protein